VVTHLNRLADSYNIYEWLKVVRIGELSNPLFSTHGKWGAAQGKHCAYEMRNGAMHGR